MRAATYYDILRVNRGTAPEGVRRAYRSLAQRYHPDKLRSSNDAALASVPSPRLTRTGEPPTVSVDAGVWDG